MIRDDDIALLKEVLDTARLAYVHDTFENMLEQLEGGERFLLSEKQRRWVSDILDRPTYENLASSGRLARGREVPTPAVLQNRPLKPPGGRA